MSKFIKIVTMVPLLLGLISCTGSIKEDFKTESAGIRKQQNSYTLTGAKNFLTGYEPTFDDGDIQVVVEIPAGTIDKWEVNKTDGSMKWEFRKGKPRVVKYVGYPGNYGMIPQTLLPKELGGDGDPLDVIVLGSPVERGSVIKCKLIGVLKLLDRGEQDDKLIAVSTDSPLYTVNSLADLNENYKGIAKIVELWFSNYKGTGKIESLGFADKKEAINILNASIEAYKAK